MTWHNVLEFLATLAMVTTTTAGSVWLCCYVLRCSDGDEDHRCDPDCEDETLCSLVREEGRSATYYAAWRAALRDRRQRGKTIARRERLIGRLNAQAAKLRARIAERETRIAELEAIADDHLLNESEIRSELGALEGESTADAAARLNADRETAIEECRRHLTVRRAYADRCSVLEQQIQEATAHRD